jgi:fumarate reductase subunit C
MSCRLTGHLRTLSLSCACLPLLWLRHPLWLSSIRFRVLIDQIEQTVNYITVTKLFVRRNPYFLFDLSCVWTWFGPSMRLISESSLTLPQVFNHSYLDFLSQLLVIFIKILELKHFMFLGDCVFGRTPTKFPNARTTYIQSQQIHPTHKKSLVLHCRSQALLFIS